NLTTAAGKSAAAFGVWSPARTRMTPTRGTETAEPPTRDETFLKDALAESLAGYAARLPEAAELLEALRAGAGAARDATPGAAPRAGAAAPARVAVRGLTGSARAFLAAWLQRATGRTVLYLVAHGEAFEAARDDLEYFRGPGPTLAFPEPDTLPYDPSSPHPSLTAQRLETLGRLDAAKGAAGVDSGPGAGHGAGVVLATVRGLLQRVPRPARLERAILKVGVGSDYDPQELVRRLVFLGYERLP